MTSYDEWKTTDPRDVETERNDARYGYERDDDREEDDVDEKQEEIIQLIKESAMPSDLEVELALKVIERQFPNSAMILRLRLGTPFDRDLDVPYRDVKFNESTRDGKGW